MHPLTYTELSAPTADPADSVMYPGEGVVELTRRARIRERELADAEARERGLREALKNIEELTWGGKGQSMVNMIAQAALAQPSEAAGQTDGEQT